MSKLPSTSASETPNVSTWTEPIAALAAYAGIRLSRTLLWVIGGTGVAWLLVWVKARAEDSATPWFLGWVWDGLLRHWYENSTEVSTAAANMATTLLRVACALLLAGTVSALIGWKTSRAPHSRRWDIIDSILGMLGGLPVFFLCFLVESSQSSAGRMPGEYHLADQLFIAMAAVVILAWGDGNGSLWVRTFRHQFSGLRRSPHIIAALARGLSIRRRLLRDTAGMLVESGGSRAVILLGGAAIVEYKLGLDSGIGYSIIREFNASRPSCTTLAAQTLVLVSVSAMLRWADAVTRDWLGRSGAIPS